MPLNSIKIESISLINFTRMIKRLRTIKLYGFFLQLPI